MGQEDASNGNHERSLPDPMKDWVEAQAKAGRYSNASDYVRDLIRRDQERAHKLAALQRLITEGMESGVSTLSAADLLKTAHERAASRRGIMAFKGQHGRPIRTSSSSASGDAVNMVNPRPSGITQDWRRRLT